MAKFVDWLKKTFKGSKSSETSIRELISTLEQSKHHLMAFYAPENKDSSPWTSDIKEAYFATVGAQQLLSRGSLESGKTMLENAKSRFDQSYSKISSDKKPEAKHLAHEWKIAFEACEAALRQLIKDQSSTKNHPTLKALIDRAQPNKKEEIESGRRRQELRKRFTELSKALKDVADYSRKSKEEFIKLPDKKQLFLPNFVMMSERTVSSVKLILDGLTNISVEKTQGIYLPMYDTNSILRDLESIQQSTADKLAKELKRVAWPFFTLLCTDMGTRLSTHTHRVNAEGKKRALVCDACDKTAVTFEPGYEQDSKKPLVLYSGIMQKASLADPDKKELYELLDANNIAGAYLLIHRYENQDRAFLWGIDAYCLQCDAIYCKDHWTLREEYDEGFYDGTKGTCPRNHTRTIDD